MGAVSVCGARERSLVAPQFGVELISVDVVGVLAFALKVVVGVVALSCAGECPNMIVHAYPKGQTVVQSPASSPEVRQLSGE